ncbi:MAG: methylmalonyl-CoA mutase subunit beta [Kordiimonas sp.]
MSNQGLTLASDFDAVTDSEWQTLVEKSLKGKPFEKAMTTNTYDGLKLKALYTSENTVRGVRPDSRKGPWNIAVPHWNPDVSVSQDAIVEDLERGANSIAVRIEAGAFPGVKYDDLAKLFEGVYLDMISFTLIPGEEFEAASRSMLDLIAAKNYKAPEVSGCLGAEPISTLAQTGRLLTSAEGAVNAAVEIAREVSGKYESIATFMVDGGLYHLSGATEGQELGLMLATGLHYLRAMEAAGMDLHIAAKQIHFSLVADTDIHLTVAKFRAARLLWGQILKSCGLEGISMNLSGVSSLRMMSSRDPWVNILRGTAACFGAGVGGANTVCVLPHDTMLGMSSVQARRIARNIQIVLQEESSLSAVMDPAAGSYSFESITTELSETAWKYFQKIEQKGGVLTALRNGLVQQDMIESWAARQHNIATRKDPVTGVSEFPDIHEKPIADVGEMPNVPVELKEAGEVIQPILFHRVAENFEAFRSLSEGLSENGVKPSIFLANLGSAADFTARATFSKNLFEAGGIEALPSDGGLEVTAIVNSYKSSGAKLAVVCGTDQLYAGHAEELVQALTAEGAKVFIAGRPDNFEVLKQAGLISAVYMGINALDVYEAAYALMGEAS